MEHAGRGKCGDVGIAESGVQGEHGHVPTQGVEGGETLGGRETRGDAHGLVRIAGDDELVAGEQAQYNFFLEDMKTLGTPARRLRSELGHIKKQWCALACAHCLLGATTQRSDWAASGFSAFTANR